MSAVFVLINILTVIPGIYLVEKSLVDRVMSAMAVGYIWKNVKISKIRILIWDDADVKSLIALSVHGRQLIHALSRGELFWVVHTACTLLWSDARVLVSSVGYHFAAAILALVRGSPLTRQPKLLCSSSYGYSYGVFNALNETKLSVRLKFFEMPVYYVTGGVNSVAFLRVLP